MSKFAVRKLWSFAVYCVRQAKSRENEKMAYALIEHPRISPQQFYGLLELELQRRQIPKLKRIVRVTRREGGFLNQYQRECLRIRRGDMAVDVCAGLYGTSLYVSWRIRPAPVSWLSWVLIVPALWQIARRNRNPRTDDALDNSVLFEEATRRAIDCAIGKVTGGGVIRHQEHSGYNASWWTAPLDRP